MGVLTVTCAELHFVSLYPPSALSFAGVENSCTGPRSNSSHVSHIPGQRGRF